MAKRISPPSPSGQPSGESPLRSLGKFADCRVLVAEDDRINQLAIQRLLQRLNCQTVTVENGRAAVNALAMAQNTGDAFDAVLMDIQMPEMDGVEATRQIREPGHPAHSPDIPIIAVTAYAMPGDRENFLEAGMDDFLPKPLELPALATALERALGRRLLPDQGGSPE